MQELFYARQSADMPYPKLEGFADILRNFEDLCSGNAGSFAKTKTGFCRTCCTAISDIAHGAKRIVNRSLIPKVS